MFTAIDSPGVKRLGRYLASKIPDFPSRGQEKGTYASFRFIATVVFQGTVRKKYPRLNCCFAVSFLGLPEVILFLSSFKAKSWLLLRLTAALPTVPNVRRSHMASLPALPATCISANCSRPKWDGKSLGFTFFVLRISSKVAPMSAILSC